MATKTDTSGGGISASAGLRADLKPRLVKHYGSDGKRKVRSMRIPGTSLRFGVTRDEGEADLFSSALYSTHLGAILRAPDRSVRGQIQPGEILDEFDLGAGKVTNIGVTALANDSNWFANTTENLATLNTQKFINWGTGTTAAEAFNWKLQTQAENEAGKKEAVAATSSLLKFLATGNAKLIITGTLEQNIAGPTPITEWGLFSAAKTEGTALTAATGATATSLTDSAGFAAPGNAISKKDARGAQQFAIFAKEAEEVYGLVLSNPTTKEAVIPGWVKSGAAEAGATPSATSKYAFFPVMWDHRVFAAINVEKGNKIEFPYELEIKSGG